MTTEELVAPAAEGPAREERGGGGRRFGARRRGCAFCIDKIVRVPDRMSTTFVASANIFLFEPLT